MHYDLFNYQSAMKLSNSLSNPATKFISSFISLMDIIYVTMSDAIQKKKKIKHVFFANKKTWLPK